MTNYFSIYRELFQNDTFILIAKYLMIILPVVLPVCLLYAAWMIRFRWITMKFIEGQKPCLLEIRLPKEITKSPAAMEIFFTHLNPGGAGNYGEAFIDGKTRPWFSCELVSTEGQVRFFVWCSQGKFRNIVESQLYAQYPNIEIVEAEDYTKDFYYDPDKYAMYGLQYDLSEPDPFPIKTYIDYGLLDDQKEEYKIDPISSIIEHLGSMKKGEHTWVQIMFQKHEKEGKFHGKMEADKILKDEIEEAIKEVRSKSIMEDESGEGIRFPNPTKGQQEVIAALERSATKTPYDCMIRNIYIAEKNSFSPINISGLIGAFKQYGSKNLNGFKPVALTDADDAKKDWGRIFKFYQNMLNDDVASKKKNLLYAYKLRSFFQLPYKNHGDVKPFVLTTEELATIFHFPSNVVSQTPTLKRVESKKSEAPANLPI